MPPTANELQWKTGANSVIKEVVNKLAFLNNKDKNRKLNTERFNRQMQASKQLASITERALASQRGPKRNLLNKGLIAPDWQSAERIKSNFGKTSLGKVTEQKVSLSKASIRMASHGKTSLEKTHFDKASIGKASRGSKVNVGRLSI